MLPEGPVPADHVHSNGKGLVVAVVGLGCALFWLDYSLDRGTERSRTALGCDSTCARFRSRTDRVTSDGYVLGSNYDHEIVGQRPGRLGQDCRSREYVIGWGTFGRAGGRLQFAHYPEQPIMSSGRRRSSETRPPHPPFQAAPRDLSNTSRLTRLNAQTDRR